MGDVVEQDGHPQLVGLVAVIFAAFLAAVPLVDDRLVVGVVYPVLVVVKNGQQPHMVNPHFLEALQPLRVLEQVLLHREIGVHGAGRMAGIHHAVGDPAFAGAVAQGIDKIADLQVRADRLAAGQHEQAADFQAGAGLEIGFKRRAVGNMGPGAVVIHAAVPFLYVVNKQQVHFPAVRLQVGGEVDQPGLHDLIGGELFRLHLPGRGVAGIIKGQALQGVEAGEEGKGVQVRRFAPGVLDRRRKLERGIQQGVGKRDVQIPNMVGEGGAVRRLGAESGRQRFAAAFGGDDVGEVPGAVFQQGVVFQHLGHVLFVAAEVKADPGKGDAPPLKGHFGECAGLFVKDTGNRGVVEFHFAYRPFFPNRFIEMPAEHAGKQVFQRLWVNVYITGK